MDYLVSTKSRRKNVLSEEKNKLVNSFWFLEITVKMKTEKYPSNS